MTQTPDSAQARSQRRRRLGISGLPVSVVGLGCNNFGGRIDEEQTRSVVHAALDAGVTLFDTADIYGQGHSEEFLGRALGARRDDVVIATKFGMDMQGANGPDWGARGSRRYIRRAVESSLRRLGTDWIDLYQMHAPDTKTPIAETLAVLCELVREGKVRYIGCSNFTAWQVADAEWTARTNGTDRFISAENHYNLLNRAVESELSPACEHFGLGILPYFPLGQRPAFGQVPQRRERARGHPPRWPYRRAVRRALRRRREARDLRGRTGCIAATRRDRRSRSTEGGGFGDRRRDQARAGEGQRRGRLVAPDT